MSDVSESTIVVHVDPNLPLEQKLALTRQGVAKARKFLDDPNNGVTEAVTLHVDMTGDDGEGG